MKAVFTGTVFSRTVTALAIAASMFASAGQASAQIDSVFDRAEPAEIISELAAPAMELGQQEIAQALSTVGPLDIQPAPSAAPGTIEPLRTNPQAGPQGPDQFAARSRPQFPGGPGQQGPGFQTQPRAVPAVQRFVAPPALVLPPTCGFQPQLEFSGRMIPGVGMQVLSTKFNGVAMRTGLEPGDIIVEINNRRITNDAAYAESLFNAAVYGGGHVDLVVKNIRYRPGCTLNPEYVTRHADLPEHCTSGIAVAGPVGPR